MDEEEGGDPSSHDAQQKLLEKQKREHNLQLQAAGVPLLLSCSSAGRDKSDQNEVLRRLDGLEGHLEEKFDHLESKFDSAIHEVLARLDKGFEALAQRSGATFQLLVNLQKSDVPRFVFAVPGRRKDEKGLLGWAKNVKKKALEWTKIKQYFVLYVIDEGPMLRPDLIEKDDKPLHDGFEVELPGHLLVKAAPVLYVFAKLFVVASIAGKAAGIPVPTEIPFVGAALAQVDKWKDKLKAFVGDFEQILEDTGNLEAVNGAIEGASSFLEEKQDESSIQDEVAALGEAVKEAAEGDERLEGIKKGVFEPGYEALKEILEKCCTKKGSYVGWSEFKESGQLGKIYSTRTGAIHWVATKHHAKLFATGEFTEAGGVARGSGAAGIRALHRSASGASL